MGTNLYENMARNLLKEGGKETYSHLIIVVDTSDSEFVKIFVERNEDIKDALFGIICNPDFEIKEIYNYDMDLEEQIKERRAYNIEAIYNKAKEAYDFAREKHEGQTWEDGSPYINHPIAVASLVEKYFVDHPRYNELKTAAYLHDTVEDTNTSIEEIRRKFGDYVAYLVKGLTNDDDLKHRIGKANYLCDKLVHMDEDILNLKLCDRLANVLDLPNAPLQFAEKFETETIIVMHYLLNNKSLSNIQKEIIKEISTQINDLSKKRILQLINSI